MKRITSLVLAGAIASFLISCPAQANPAVLAPAAFCAGTAGVGCALVAVGTVGTIAVYVWRRSDGKTVRANASGQILKSGYLEDPEEEMDRMGNNAATGRIVRAKNATEAFNICSKFSSGRKTAQPLDLKNGRFQCRYH